MNFPTCPTQAPIRVLVGTIGNCVWSTSRSRASVSSPSSGPDTSLMIPVRSRILSSASRMPGFSIPKGPNRKSFIFFSFILNCPTTVNCVRLPSSKAAGITREIQSQLCNLGRCPDAAHGLTRNKITKRFFVVPC